MVPFRGCNCTDAAGKEFAYKDVVKMLAKSEKGRRWDTISKTPYFHYRENETVFQVWYEDPESLNIKYQVQYLR